MSGELFTKVCSGSNLSAKPHKWIGNDDTQRHHHGLVRLDDQPFEIILKWKTASDAFPKLVGYYRLHLQNLRLAGYVADPRGGQVRLRFYHGHDDCVYIQPLNRNAPALDIGKLQDKALK